MEESKRVWCLEPGEMALSRKRALLMERGGIMVVRAATMTRKEVASASGRHQRKEAAAGRQEYVHTGVDMVRRVHTQC